MPEGRRQLQSGKRLVVELLNSLVTPFSRQEIETLIALLQRMMGRMQEAEAVSATPQPPEAPRTRRGARSGTAQPRRGRRFGKGEPT